MQRRRRDDGHTTPRPKSPLMRLPATRELVEHLQATNDAMTNTAIVLVRSLQGAQITETVDSLIHNRDDRMEVIHTKNLDNAQAACEAVKVFRMMEAYDPDHPGRASGLVKGILGIVDASKNANINDLSNHVKQGEVFVDISLKHLVQEHGKELMKIAGDAVQRIPNKKEREELQAEIAKRKPGTGLSRH